MSTFTRRLKEMRLEAGFSQEKLGILAGIDPATARSRVNSYERGKHSPDFLTVQQLAAVLDVPEGYFYTADDDAAKLLMLFHRMQPAQRTTVLALAESLK